MVIVLDSVALDNPQCFPSVPITNLMPLTSKFTPHCLACNNKVGSCNFFSFANWPTVNFVSRGKEGILKEEGVSLPVSSPLLYVGFYCFAWFMHHQALAVHVASAGPRSSSTHGFSSTWPQ